MNHGADGSLVTATPNAGYHFVSWSDGVLTADRARTSNVTANLSVTANFAINTYTLTYTAGAERVDRRDVAADGEPRRGREPGDGDAGSGYHFVSWSDGVLTAARTDTNVTAEHERDGDLRDQHLHPDLHGWGQRHDRRDHAADGEPRRGRHAW